MDHIRLSPRLQMVADFVPPCACAADIGTDHGYLPVWLLQNGIAETAIAADIHAGPLANARQSADDYDLTERFRFVLADGLQFPDAQDADIITVAGMGGETICAIMAAAPWLQEGRRLILQPQSKVAELTDWLWRSGFTIEDVPVDEDDLGAFSADDGDEVPVVEGEGQIVEGDLLIHGTGIEDLGHMAHFKHDGSLL